MTNIGKIEEFGGGDFKPYKERLDAYFVANDIGICADPANAASVTKADKKKLATLISLIGKDGYQTLKDVCLPSAPMEKSYD